MATKIAEAPKIGMVSLGCPKALVDSERILTKLRADGYAMSPDYAGADVVLVNTCGFLDSAKEESLEAIGEALAENGRVIVTGCIGNEAELIRARFPKFWRSAARINMRMSLAPCMIAAPCRANAFINLVPEGALKLTPRHYSYLKISEGCNHRCAFCIIPQLRGDLASRRIDAVLREAEKLVCGGDQRTARHIAGYLGIWRRYPPRAARLERPEVRAHMTDLARELGGLRTPEGRAPWVRLHYVYPYPHVDDVIPLMADGLADPLSRHSVSACSAIGVESDETPRERSQGAGTHPQMARYLPPTSRSAPASSSASPARLRPISNICSIGCDEAQLDRVGAFRFEPVEGAAANALPDPVPEEVKEERYQRIMAKDRRDQRRQTRRQGRTDAAGDHRRSRRGG